MEALSRDELVERHLHLVCAIARRLHSALPSYIPLADLVTAGNYGLLQAADAYDADRGVIFSAFAKNRVRGAMLDHLRDIRHGRRRLDAPLMLSNDSDEVPEPVMLDGSPEPGVFQREVRQQLEALMAEVLADKPMQLEILRLFYFEEMLQQDIATLLDRHNSRISQLHLIALAKLKQAMDERGLAFTDFIL